MDWDRLRRIGEKVMAGRLRRLTATGRLGKFQLVRRLGEGGMGEVWLAQDEERGPVALKILTGVRDSDVERFQREAELASQLDHPRIVKIYEAGEIEGYSYIAMQYIAGTPFKEKPADVREAVRCIADIADAVHAAHERGVVHRDIKPENLIRGDDGQVYLTDFGLALDAQSTQASTSRSGWILGTPAYMAPEIARGHPRDATPRSDVYALGASLYFLVGGEVPFPGENLYDVLAKIVEADPPPLSVDKDLNTIIRQAMAKDPGQRYASAKALAEDLRRYLRGERISARRPFKPPRYWKVYVLAAVAAMAAYAGWILYERQRATEDLRASLQKALELRRNGETAPLVGLWTSMEATYRSTSSSAENEYLMGRMRRAMLQDEEALYHQKRALELDSDHLPARYEKIVLEVRLKKPAARDDALPPDSAAHGLVAFAESRWDEAVANLTAATQRDPALEEAWETLASIALRNKQWEAAEGFSNKGLANDKGYVPHWMNRGQARLERALMALKHGVNPTQDLSAAAEDFSKALQLHPNLSRALVGRASARGSLADATEHELALAENDCKEALRLNSEDAEALYCQAKIRIKLGDFAYFNEQVQIDPSPWYLPAIQELTDVLKKRPDHIEALTKRALTRVKNHIWKRGWNLPRSLDELKSAQEDVEQALRFDPASLDALVARAMVKETLAVDGPNFLNDVKSALSDIDQVLQKDDQWVEAWVRKGYIHLHRAVSFKSGKKAREEYYAVMKAFEKAVTLNPLLKSKLDPTIEEARKKCAE